MAEPHEISPKTFRIAYGDRGDKKNVFGGFYSRIRHVRDADNRKFVNNDQDLVPGKPSTATDERRALFGLWSKKEEYIWSGRQEQDVVFRRTHETSSNGFRRKEVEFYENGAEKRVDRRYLGGLYHTASELDSDGEELSHTEGDFVGFIKHSRSRDGRNSSIEQSDLFGLYGKKREALRLPDGETFGWRTVQRRIGAYRMEVVPDKEGSGETRNRSFGRLFERSTHYNFKTGNKVTTYRIPFLGRERENKKHPMDAKDVQKHNDRADERAAARTQWDRYSVGLGGKAGSEKTSSDYGKIFEQSLNSRSAVAGADKNLEIERWRDGSARFHPGEGKNAPSISTPFSDRRGVARFGDDLESLRPGDSISVAGASAVKDELPAYMDGRTSKPGYEKGPERSPDIAPLDGLSTMALKSETGLNRRNARAETERSPQDTGKQKAAESGDVKNTDKKAAIVRKPLSAQSSKEQSRAPASIANSSVVAGETLGTGDKDGRPLVPSPAKEKVASAPPVRRAGVVSRPVPTAAVARERQTALGAPSVADSSVAAGDIAGKGMNGGRAPAPQAAREGDMQSSKPLRRAGVVARPIPVAPVAREHPKALAAPSIADSSIVAGNYSPRPNDRDRGSSRSSAG